MVSSITRARAVPPQLCVERDPSPSPETKLQSATAGITRTNPTKTPLIGAAKRFFKPLLRGLQYKPSRLLTDDLHSYGAAHRAVMPDVRHGAESLPQQQSR